MKIIDFGHASVIQKDIYNHEIDEVVLAIKKRFDGNICTVENFDLGQSGAVKKVITIDNQKFFLKIGEKVENENAIYHNFYFAKNNLFLSPIDDLTQLSNAIIIPFYDGITLDKFIFCSKISPDNIYKLLEGILNKTSKELWVSNLKKNEKLTNISVDNYIQDRISSLFDVMFNDNSNTFSFREIMDFKVVYTVNNKKYELPSINVIINDVLNLFKKFNAPFSSCVTGDFQPTNIIINNDKFKIIDLSNGSLDGDIAMDIGKFFNFINRFYNVALLRDDKLSDCNNGVAKMLLNKGIIDLNFISKTDHVLENMMSILEENFVRKLGVEIKDYYLPDRVKLYKFVVNLITFRRHIRDDRLLDLLFASLFDSYLEIQQKIKYI